MLVKNEEEELVLRLLSAQHGSSALRCAGGGRAAGRGKQMRLFQTMKLSTAAPLEKHHS